ncbi:MAG: C40 family peptidase [Candidatus Krumholzibacteria bacterium]|nr:C40 family peptidase [Candidatus Krumholzibacteria bacterium]
MDNVLQRLCEAVSAAEKECGLDWRRSYSKLTSRERGSFELELTREEVLRALPRHLEEFSLDRDERELVRAASAAGLTVRFRLLAPAADRLLWVTSSVADVRREGAHSAELLTQIIMGDAAYQLKEEGDWRLVRLPDDYHGWIRSWYLRETDAREIAAYAAAARAVVTANVGYVLSAADEKSLPVSEAVAGTRLVAAPPAGGYRAVNLPGGKSGFIREELLAERGERAEPDRGRLVGRAMRFIGIPYLWGGTTPKGFDCSGLVQRVFLMEGVSLPRDSDMQALVGDLIPKEDAARLAPGDLLFFGEGTRVTHVAISIGEGRYIHSSGEVRISSLLSGDDRYDEKFLKIFLFARSVFR